MNHRRISIYQKIRLKGRVLHCLFIFLLLAFFPSTTLYANVIVNAEIDSVHILIGNQAHVRLSVVQDDNEHVQFPFFDDLMAPGVEIVRKTEPDTAKLGNRRLEIFQNYTVAVFDSGLYYMPPFKFVAQADTFETNSLTLVGVTVPVDTVNIAIYDIKPIMPASFSWKRFFISFAIIILVLAATVYVIVRLVRRKPVPFQSLLPVDELDPHDIALQELDKIKSEKGWTYGRQKEFYTKITNILRTYFENRFGIGAMEMTSDEILEYLSNIDEAKPVLDNLKQVLKTADLVKFAKMECSPEENEQSISNSYLVVNATKPEMKNEE